MPKPEPKLLKIPKTLGACADLLHDVREQRLGLQHQAEAIKPNEARLREHIINNVPKGDAGAVGQRYIATVEPTVVFQVGDWEALYAHIKKTGDFSLLNRALVAGRVSEILGEQELANQLRQSAGKKPLPVKLPPGVVAFNTVKVSITKRG